MKKCPTCGKEYDADSNFCPLCGVELTEAPAREPNLLAENVTVMTAEAVKSIYKKTKTLGIVFTVLGGVFILLDILAALIPQIAEFSGLLYVGIIMLIFGVVFILSEKNAMKNNTMIIENSRTVYHLFDDEIHSYDYNGEKKRGETYVSYSQITLVRKSEEYYYLYFGNLVWVVCKSGFTIGTEADFCRILREKCNVNVLRF